MRERTISTISLSVALAIGGVEIFNQIEKFSKEATDNEYTSFTHQNFFYSYPEFGKSWKNGKSCEFHRVQTKCHLCDFVPERNYAGIGSMYLLNNGTCNDEILVNDGYEVVRGKKVYNQKYVPNSPIHTRMILLCENHIGSYFKWNPHQERKKEMQLKLF
jgi:hypothetical protein